MGFVFYCMNDNIFISLIYVCDGSNDCFDGEDEKNCQIENEFYFECISEKKNIGSVHVCDYVNDCDDHSDEKNCCKC